MAVSNDPATAPRPPLAYRMTSRQWLAVDVVVALVAAGLLLAGGGLEHGLHHHESTAVTAVLAAAVTLPVAVRRCWPVPVLAVVTGAGSVLTALGRAPVVVDVMLGLAAYLVATRCRRRTAIVALAGSELMLTGGILAAAAQSHAQADALRSLLTVGALWFIGDSVRERRRYLAGLAGQATARQQAEAERAQQAVRDERVRIARELHDVVAHSLSMVTIQAGVGRKIGADRPAEAVAALRAIEVTGRSMLEELRRILGLLYDDTGQPSLAPAPGLADLDELAATVRSAGTPVRLAVSGEAAELPPAASLTVYRIVQEALTNVAKHAHGAQASVRVQAGREGVRIRVSDDGRGMSAGPAGLVSGGHGIVGMRERAAAFGGTLEAGPLPGGGFRVTAFLPVPGEAVAGVRA